MTTLLALTLLALIVAIVAEHRHTRRRQADRDAVQRIIARSNQGRRL